MICSFYRKKSHSFCNGIEIFFIYLEDYSTIKLINMRLYYKLITLVAGFFISLFSIINAADGRGCEYWFFLLIGIVVFYTGVRILE
jgi:hypothetical protein